MLERLTADNRLVFCLVTPTPVEMLSVYFVTQSDMTGTRVLMPCLFLSRHLNKINSRMHLKEIFINRNAEIEKSPSAPVCLGLVLFVVYVFIFVCIPNCFSHQMSECGSEKIWQKVDRFTSISQWSICDGLVPCPQSILYIWCMF